MSDAVFNGKPASSTCFTKSGCCESISFGIRIPLFAGSSENEFGPRVIAPLMPRSKGEKQHVTGQSGRSSLARRISNERKCEVNHRVSALDPLADASHYGRHRPWDIEGRVLKHCVGRSRDVAVRDAGAR